MSIREHPVANSSLSPSFRYGSQGSPEEAKKTPSPFSLRLDDEERAELKQRAGRKPMGAYIRQELFGDEAKPRKALRSPQVDDQKVSLILSMLGESRLSSNLNQLAKHANMGTLDMSKETEEQIITACASVIAMRNLLLKALGHKP